MTLANKLTVARLFLALLTFACLWTRRPSLYVAALGLYLVATITDWVDGYIARRTRSVSAFGAMADPVADKALVLGALLAFVRDPAVHAPAWAVFLIIVRELVMGGLRALAAVQGKVFAADRIGKWSMGVQSTCVIIILLGLAGPVAFGLPPGALAARPEGRAASYALVVLCAAVSVLSGAAYAYKTRTLLRSTWNAPKA